MKWVSRMMVLALMGAGARAPAQNVNPTGPDVEISNKKGTWVLKGDEGTASFRDADNKSRDCDLKLVKEALIKSPDGDRHGWIYKAKDKDKRFELWFFFSDTRVGKDAKGKELYPLYFSTTTDDDFYRWEDHDTTANPDANKKKNRWGDTMGPKPAIFKEKGLKPIEIRR